MKSKNKWILTILFVLVQCIILYQVFKETFSVQNISWNLLRMKDDILLQSQEQTPGDTYESIESMEHYKYLPSLTKWSIAQFTEVTTANRDESTPFYPDFNFVTGYGENNLVIYEAYNPGCMFRLQLVPLFDRGLGVNGWYRDRQRLVYDTDGQTYNYTLAEVARADKYPFLKPFSISHRTPQASGVVANIPICYEKYLKVTYYLGFNIPRNLLKSSAHCTTTSKTCPNLFYVGISRHALPFGTTVKTFKSIQQSETANHKTGLETFSNALKSSESNGPDKFQRCHLKCAKVSKKEVIFGHEGSAVITTIKFRVFTKNTEGTYELSPNWNDILLTIMFDGADFENAQVKDVPLGSLFASVASLSNTKTAMMGLQNKNCTYQSGKTPDFAETTRTGYFYFPMPFWKSAKILVRPFNERISRDLYLCYQMTTAVNSYSENTNGYFHIAHSYFGGSPDGWRKIISVEKGRGHIVAVFLGFDNGKLTYASGGRYFFRMIEADQVIFLDHRKEASMLGSGFEDFFSCAHMCKSELVNGSNLHTFTGAYEANKLPPRLVSDSLVTRHFYRFHIFDPIPFQSSILFTMQGLHDVNYQEQAPTVSYKEYRELYSKKNTTSSHMVFWYGRKETDFALLDFIDIGNRTSENSHNFSADAQTMNEIFQLKDKKFIGQRTNKLSYNATYRAVKNSITFTLKQNPDYQYLLLRRQYYNRVFVWKQDAVLSIDGKYHGRWHVAMGATAESFVLREDDIVITNRKNTAAITVTVQPITEWNDIRYELFGFQKKLT